MRGKRLFLRARKKMEPCGDVDCGMCESDVPEPCQGLACGTCLSSGTEADAQIHCEKTGHVVGDYVCGKNGRDGLGAPDDCPRRVKVAAG